VLPSFGSDKQLEASIGKQVRIARQNAGVTLQQLSKQSSLSASMLSKIENGQISASLKTIQSICHALNISITSLFKQHDKDVEPTFIKSGEGLTIERAGSDEGRHYQLREIINFLNFNIKVLSLSICLKGKWITTMVPRCITSKKEIQYILIQISRMVQKKSSLRNVNF
jgi:transcriptional regulator with XRE-family HTH domain